MGAAPKPRLVVVSRFEDRNAVVTGAKGEIGAAVARALAERGARVWAADIGFAERVDQEPRGSGRLTALPLDVTDAPAVAATFARIAAEAGPVTLLVNLAGGPGRARTPVESVTDAQWRGIVGLNLDGVFHCCREAVRSMKAAGLPGAVVNVSSGAGRTYSRTGVQAYAAAKAGVIGLTRQLARELGSFGIRVNCVAPGLIDVAGIRDEIAAIPEAGMRAHLANVALGRLGRADDLVEPILFFLGEGAAYVTGQTISVDGGSVMLG